MKKSFALFTSLLLSTVLISVAAVSPSGSQLAEIMNTLTMQEESRTFNVSNFDKLDLGSAFTIHVSRGSGYKVTASGRSSDLEELEAKVSGGKLQIRYKDKLNWNRNRQRVTVNITMPELSSVEFSGASRSDVTGFRNIKELGISISGASSSTIEVDAERVMVDLSGASSVTLSGQAKRLQGEVSGATTLKAYDLKVASATVDLSGASSARMHVTDRLEAEASGASNLTYRGSASLRSNTSGASSIKSADR
ncbi:head GIN domain-containing protein [Larkinella insperata]|uniref:Head GIN domain-containing protein n=1 Tax=Larkinella insperata TaxID=332158 RepID=A0ABW3QMG5_9BACT|nr:head GIN domain-containing protein [Larkinella insperata]